MSITWPAGARETTEAQLLNTALASGDVLNVRAREVIRDGVSIERVVVVRVGKGAPVELTVASQVTDLAAALTAAAAVLS